MYGRDAACRVLFLLCGSSRKCRTCNDADLSMLKAPWIKDPYATAMNFVNNQICRVWASRHMRGLTN